MKGTAATSATSLKTRAAPRVKPVKPVKQKPKPVPVLHFRSDDSVTTGRRNPLFPLLDIRKTAAGMNMSEGRLGRLLAKKQKPGMAGGKRIASLLGITLDEVEEIFNDDRKDFCGAIESARQRASGSGR